MTNAECKKAIHQLFEKKNFSVHLDNKALRVNGKSYRVQPDDAYYFLNQTIYLIEYEYNKRPIESISKFWWLFEDTDILDCVSMIKLLVITTNEKIGKIRNRSMEILGEELENKYPDKLKFYFIPDYLLTVNSIKTAVEAMFD